MALAPFPRRIILCLGDSITEQGWGVKGNRGWVAELASAYARRADIVNRGYGGFTTRTLEPIANRVFASLDASGEKTVVTTVFLGANDSNADSGTRLPQQNVPIEEYESRLRRIAQGAMSRSDAVLLIAPGPVDDRRWPTRSNAHVKAYGEAVARIARDTGALFVDLLDAAGGPFPDRSTLASDSEAPWLDLLSDGLHLSSSGNALLAERILATLRARAPRSAPEGVPQDFPHWSGILLAQDGSADQVLDENNLTAFRARTAEAAQACAANSIIV